MRLLIAGWQGQVARALVEAAPGCPDIAACAAGRPALDICEPRSIERALAGTGPDVVINAAAYTEVDRAESEPGRCFALNRDGARLLAEAAARRGVPVIHLSTDQVFDGRKEVPYTETDAPAPQSVYGRSRLAGEEAVAAANPRHIILRTAWVHSPTGKNFVRTVLRRAREQGCLRIVADRRGSPTFAPHLGAAVLAIARRLTQDGKDRAGSGLWGIYHAAGAGAATWFEVAEEVLRCAGRYGEPPVPLEPISAAEYPAPAARPQNSVLACGKLAANFGLHLPPWREGIAECVERILGGRTG